MKNIIIKKGVSETVEIKLAQSTMRAQSTMLYPGLAAIHSRNISTNISPCKPIAVLITPSIVVNKSESL